MLHESKAEKKRFLFVSARTLGPEWKMSGIFLSRRFFFEALFIALLWHAIAMKSRAITRVVILIICLLALSLSVHENRFALQVKSSFLKLFLTQKKISRTRDWNLIFCDEKPHFAPKTFGLI